MRTLLFLVFINLLSVIAFAQVELSGRLLDKNSEEPIKFSNVFFQKSQSIGTATNEQGYFTLKLPKGVNPSDTIVFSSINYGVSKLPLSYFQNSSNQTDILLEPLAHEIKPIFISAPSDRAKQIVREALKNRKRTFNRRPHVLHAFFRETTIHLYDSVYSSLAEADITILDYGINATSESNRILINELRTSDDFRSEIHTNPHMKTLAASLKRSNAVINAYNHAFKRCDENKCFAGDFFDRNDFFFLKEIYNKNDTIDVIGFLPKSIKEIENRKFTLTCKLFINRTDKAILKYEYKYDFDNGFFLYLIQTFEKNSDGLYYPKLFIWDYSYASKTIYFYDISRSYFDRVKVRWANTEKPTEDIFDKEYTYNPDFWDNYSTIELIPAPEKMHQDLERNRNLVEQFQNSE